MRENDSLVNELLVKWHRWTSEPVRLDDSLLRDFDTIMATLSNDTRAALVIHARNLCAEVTVWSSFRVSKDGIEAARAHLTRLLQVDPGRWFGRRILYLNERGNRIGESNPMAKLSDHEVDLLLELRDEKNQDGSHRYSLQWLADKFEVSKSAVQWYCNGGRRGQMPAKVRAV